MATTRWADPFIKSIQRLKQLGPWDVLLSNHSFMAQPKDLGEIEDVGQTRQRPACSRRRPRTDPEFFDLAVKLARQKQALEQQRKLSQ
jgi:hypothetical protein